MCATTFPLRSRMSQRFFGTPAMMKKVALHVSLRCPVGDDENWTAKSLWSLLSNLRFNARPEALSEREAIYSHAVESFILFPVPLGWSQHSRIFFKTMHVNFPNGGAKDRQRINRIFKQRSNSLTNSSSLSYDISISQFKVFDDREVKKATATSDAFLIEIRISITISSQSSSKKVLFLPVMAVERVERIEGFPRKEIWPARLVLRHASEKKCARSSVGTKSDRSCRPCMLIVLIADAPGSCCTAYCRRTI
eukprot:284814558_4